MSKLLFVYERDMPTVSITRNVFTSLKKYPEIEADFIYLTDVKNVDIDKHDVIIFIRPNNVYAWIIACEAREAGHIVVTFCDDDLLNLPSIDPTIPWRKKGLVKTLNHSDIIWSSSKYILNKYVGLTAGHRMAVIDTIVAPEEIENISEKDEKETVKIVYAAAPSHARLFEKYISPIVPRLAEKYGNRISFTLISAHPTVEGAKCNYLAGMPLLDYRKFMKENRFDIGVAPLLNDEFSKCKYFNKFIEYSTQGIMGIYSKTEPYTDVVIDGVNGLLAEDNSESWYRALDEAINDQTVRKRCVSNAIEYIRQNHSEEACIERMIAGIPEMKQVNSNYSNCKNFGLGKIYYHLSRPWDWGYLFFFYLFHTGFKALKKRIRTHFVEIKAYKRNRN